MINKNYATYWIVCFLTVSMVQVQLSVVANDISNRRIIIVCTAAVLDENYETRKQEYIQAIEKIKQFGFMPYIVESCKNGPTFLDALSDKVWYAKTNDFRLQNKGVNEAKSLLNFFEHNEFSDDDIIVKVTGRYMFIDDSFLRYIESHIEYDAFVKDVGKRLIKGDIFSGCFAMKHKYFIEFLRQLDLQKMEEEMSCVEWELADYVALRKEMKTCFMERLGVAYHFSCYNQDSYI